VVSHCIVSRHRNNGNFSRMLQPMLNGGKKLVETLNMGREVCYTASKHWYLGELRDISRAFPVTIVNRHRGENADKETANAATCSTAEK
jgi:hypothetical protein